MGKANIDVLTRINSDSPSLSNIQTMDLIGYTRLAETDRNPKDLRTREDKMLLSSACLAELTPAADSHIFMN